MAGHLTPIPQRGHAAAASHAVRLVVLTAVYAAVWLTLRFQAHRTLPDSASEFFPDALALYWVYCVGIDLFEHFFAAGSEDDEESSSASAFTRMLTTATITACAAVVLALAAFIGARVRRAGVGGTSFPILILILGVIDARVVADALEHVARMRRSQTWPS